MSSSEVHEILSKSDSFVRFSKSRNGTVEVKSSDVLHTGKVLLYFGFFKCPPCRKIHEILNDLVQSGEYSMKRVPIVYVSVDSSQKDFDLYFSGHPWFALNYETEHKKSIPKLEKLLQLKSFPQVMLIDTNHDVIIPNLESLLLHKQKDEFLKQVFN